MNLTYFQILLQKAIDDSTTTLDYLLLARAIEKLNLGQIRSVPTYANLPDAASNEGLLVWVTADERLYWSTGADWFSIVSDSQGATWAWGYNGEGNLGDGTTTNTSSPVSVIGGISDWCQASTGGQHNVVVRSSGTLWSWGINTSGQLGNNTITNRSSPVSVIGGITNWCQTSASRCHSLAVRTSGSAWAWGFNCNGRLGDGTTTDRSSPVSVMGGFTNWCQASSKEAHSAGLRSDGTIWSWGLNSTGELGDGTTTDRSSPVSVVGGVTDWCQISVGDFHTVAIRSSGSAWAWGNNGIPALPTPKFGQLGDGTTTDRSSPVSVVGGFSDWCQISAGGVHTLAVRSSGTMWSWGYNSFGQLAHDTTTNTSSPVSVVGGISDWCQISAGTFHSVAVRTSGSAWSWGSNTYGRLGHNTTTDRSSPVSVVGGFSDWCQVSGGCYHTVAIRQSDFT